MAVNGETYAADDLKQAIRLAKGGTTPIELLVKDKDTFRTVRIDYHDGLRYPRLEHLAGPLSSLDEILKPLK